MLKGTKDGVTRAKQAIRKLVEEQDSFISQTMQIPYEFHGLLIGSKGMKLQEIVTSALGSYQPGLVIFPGQDQPRNEIVLKGDKLKVSKVREALEKEVKELSKRSMLKIRVPVSDKAIIIGKGGKTISGIQNEFQVIIDIDKSIASDEQAKEMEVVIRGDANACKLAADKISALIRDETVLAFPKDLELSNSMERKRWFSRVRGEWNVSIDVLDTLPAEVKVINIGMNDNESTQNVIFWQLRGSKDELPLAVRYLEKNLIECQNFPAHDTITVPKELHKRLVGKKGAVLNKIRQQTKCRIELPRMKDGLSVSDQVRIFGTDVGIVDAKRMIQEFAENAKKPRNVARDDTLAEGADEAGENAKVEAEYEDEDDEPRGYMLTTSYSH